MNKVNKCGICGDTDCMYDKAHNVWICKYCKFNLEDMLTGDYWADKSWMDGFKTLQEDDEDYEG